MKLTGACRMSRKTFEVDKLRIQVNRMLLDTVDSDFDFREGQIQLLESILLATGNYKGFAFLNKQDMVESVSGTTVGINKLTDNPGLNFHNTDKTRIRYA